MFWRKKKHEVRGRVTGSEKETFLVLNTNDAELAAKVAQAMLTAAALSGNPSTVKVQTGKESDKTYSDPNYEEWSKNVDFDNRLEELIDAQRRIMGGLSQLDRRVEEASRRVADNVAKSSSIQSNQQKIDAVLAVGNRPIKVDLPKVEEEKKETPTPPTDTPAAVPAGPPMDNSLAARIGTDKLAAMNAIAASKTQSAAAAIEQAPVLAPHANFTSRIEPDGTVTFRVKYTCPSCSYAAYRYARPTNDYIKCHICKTRIHMEPATSEVAYDGRVNQEVPVADAEGNVFHATRLA